MVDIVIYSSEVCPYCVRAKDLLKRKGQSWVEINISQQPERRAEMVEKSGGRQTVPQIFIGAHHVGGCDDLYALDKAGGLDALLAG